MVDASLNDDQYDLFTGDLILLKSTAEHWFLRFCDDVAQWIDGSTWTHAAVVFRNPVVRGTPRTGLFVVAVDANGRHSLMPLLTMFDRFVGKAFVRRLRLSGQATTAVSQQRVTQFLDVDRHYPPSRGLDLQRLAATICGEYESSVSPVERLPSAAFAGSFIHSMGLAEPSWNHEDCRPDTLVGDAIPWVRADSYELAVPLSAVAVRTLAT